MEKIYEKFLAAYVRFKHDDSGATLVEYGIAITLAVVLGGGALIALAGSIAGAMNEAGTEMRGTPVTF